MNPIKFCGKVIFDKSLQNTGPVNTFSRVCTSDHVEDLQWIAFFTLGFLVVFGALSVIFHWSTFFRDQAITVTAVAATAAAILNWVYQTGSSRLGVVDLFGCEISAICRVSIVIDFAQSCVNAVKAFDTRKEGVKESNPKKTSPFTSEENYTPVYDGKVSDLQPLDADVLNSVTEFYTYRKTMADCMRHLAVLPADSAARRPCSVQMIYMQFLMYESGHKAVERLIEFEPSQTESLINILCSELVLYGFLLDEYGKQKDYRYERLKMRENHYRSYVSKLYKRATEDHGDASHHWERARTTANELKARFDRAIPAERYSPIEKLPVAA